MEVREILELWLALALGPAPEPRAVEVQDWGRSGQLGSWHLMEVHWLPGQEERSGAVEVASIVDQ